jgi:putative transposase
MHSSDNSLTIDDQLWENAVRREAVLRPLIKKPHLTAEEVAASCKTLGIKPAYFYRLLSAYKKDQRVSALLPRKSGRSRGAQLLPDKIEKIVEAAIREHYLSKQKPRVSKLHRLIALETHKAGMPCPSRKAIDYRLRNIHPAVLLSEREGAKAASDKMRPVIGSLQAQHPLQVVQVDHTKVDVFVVDEKHRLPIQRPCNYSPLCVGLTRWSDVVRALGS